MGEIKSDRQEIKNVKKQLISSHLVVCVYFLSPASLNVSYQKDYRWIFFQSGGGIVEGGEGRFEVCNRKEPRETRRPSYRPGITRSTKFFIKLSGEGRSRRWTSAAFNGFSRVSEKPRSGAVVASPGGGATLGTDVNVGHQGTNIMRRFWMLWMSYFSLVANVFH